MRRAAAFVFRNWPLKLGAILLATVLYSGLVLGQNVRTFSGEVPVDQIRPPTDATLINQLEPVTQIRYRAPLDVGVLSPGSFRATVDLSLVVAEPGGPPVSLPVNVVALDPRVQIVDYQPREVQVQLDKVDSRDVPVSVTLGSVPDGVNVGPPQVDPESVTVRGASSRVQSVAQVVARVAIDASALNVDRSVDLVPVDTNGNRVPLVELDPARARVRIAVARLLATLTLPVVPVLSGAPAAGYRITSVSVEPLVVTVSGEEAVVSHLDNAPTEAIDISDRTSDLEAEVPLALPDGVSVTGSDTRACRLDDRPGDRFGNVPGRHRPHRAPAATLNYSLATPQTLVILSGPTVTLQGLDATTLVATASVAGLAPGTQTVSLAFDPPAGLSVASMTPAEVSVVISASPTVSTPPVAP